jgi:DNA primase
MNFSLDSFLRDGRMLIDKAEIERVKRANELVAFIRSRGVTLTQRGKQLVGLCPFHDDYEPSLVVDPRKQLWNCLGACHEGGDVYRFVMKADGVDFREAHLRLKAQSGVESAGSGVATYDSRLQTQDFAWSARWITITRDCLRRRQRRTTGDRAG